MVDKMRIVILGDSLTLDRPPEGLYFKDTYGGLIKERLRGGGHEVFIRGGRRIDTLQMIRPERLVYDIEQFEPDIVILHVGIVDCAPRLFTRQESEIVFNLPKPVKTAIVGFMSKHRYFFTKLIKKVYVWFGYFEDNIDILLSKIEDVGAVPVVINIAQPPDHVARRSYNFLENVKKYNDALEGVARKHGCRIVDFHTETIKHPDYLFDDGIHPNLKGSRVLAEMLLEQIQDIRRERGDGVG